MKFCNNLKEIERQDLNSMINDFFNRGGKIQEIPSNIYRREELSLTNKRAILETSANKIGGERKEMGHALKEVNRIAYKKREIMEAAQ